MDSIEWFYVDIDGESKGPITTNDVKQLPLDVFVWNGTTVTEWTELKDIQSMLHDDNKDSQYQNDTDNINPKPKLQNYWSISNKMNTINIGSPSHTLTTNNIAENDFDYSKYSVQKNENILIKSNLQKQLQNNPIIDNAPKQKRKTVNVRSDIKIIKQSVTQPPTFSPDDVISNKFEKILDALQIAERARHAMREWTEDKKLQMILQYDFKHKSELLNKKKKNISKKAKKLFKKNNKKKKSFSKKQNNKEWNFGFNPLPISNQYDEKSSDNYNGNVVESSIQTITKSVPKSAGKKTESDLTKFKINNDINEFAKLEEIDRKQQEMYMDENLDNEENIYISYESTRQNDVLSITKDSNINYDDCDDSFIAEPIIFNIVNEKEKNYECDVNTLSVQHDYLNVIIK